MAPSGVPVERVPVLLEKLLRIPVAAREFTIDAEAAWRYHRIPADLLDFMRAEGLPAGHDGDVTRFDRADVLNIASHLGTSAARAARRFWAAGMTRGTATGVARYEIEYRLTCPDPGHPAPCRYRLVLPGLGPVERHLRADPSGTATVSVEVSLDTDWPPLPAPARDLVDTTRDIEFMRLPPALQDDLAFIRATKISDCVGVARLLTAEGARRGLPVRLVSGLLVVLPYSTRHSWAEFLVDGRWVPIDPVFISAMLEWGVLDPQTWNPYRSPGAILCPITGDPTPLAEHDGLQIPVQYPTRRLRQSGG
jgi:hypothetical protein